jgi:Protein of unknown function (DUF3551)
MRAMLLAAATLAAVSVGTSSSHATEGPWCAWVTIGQGNGFANCSMLSFEMCRQEITGGNRGSCYPNPRFGHAYGSPRSRRSHYE